MHIGHQPVFGVIGAANHLFFRREGREGGDRAECFLAHDLCSFGHVFQNRRLEIERAETVDPAAGQQRRTQAHRVFRMLDLLGNRPLIHQRSDIRIVKPAAEREGGRPFRKFLAKFLVDRLFNIKAVGAEAILTGGGEFGLDRLFNGLVHIRIGEHDKGRMAAKFQTEALDGRGALRIEQPSDFRRSRKG